MSNIPDSTYYPLSLDTDDNLFVVHDALRMVLAEDYNPGDTTIFLDGDPNVLSRWPTTGLITLTEQCSELDKRAVSFYYDSVDLDALSISGLIIMPGFPDVVKPKRITHVTENVMAEHHNHIKDAVIAIQEFIGIQGTVDSKPLGPTLEGRINFLRKLVLTPKAYFSVDKRIGLVPLTVDFTDLSFRLGTDGTTGDIRFVWDFGDETTQSISTTISATSVVSVNDIDVYVEDIDGGTIQKTYSTPGIYSVKLTVSNDYGSDTIIWPDLINARVEAPLEAVVNYVPGVSQELLFAGSPNGGPYDDPPLVRTPVNTLLTLTIPDGENPHNPGYSYVGEKLTTGGVPIDPVVSYTWYLGDDLEHNNLSTTTKASYSLGGIYDMKLRVDTAYGSYRITNYKNSIDVIEKYNMWLWIFSGSTGDVTAYEYGLLSETFKASGASTYTVSRDSSFLEGGANSDQMIREFNRNTGWAPRSTTPSGSAGDLMLFYASGRASAQPISAETVNTVGFNGFTDSYDLTTLSFGRPWNWASFASSTTAFFAFGTPTSVPSPNTSPADPVLTSYNLMTMATEDATLTTTNFRNGGQELLDNVSLFDTGGGNLYGNFSVYRTAWKGQTGYMTRNDGVGQFFRIKSFYKTEGTVGTPIQFFTKLIDMPGGNKLEGEMVPLTQGLYFFNNSGSVAAYNDTTGIWETGSPVANTASFRQFQDTDVNDFDNLANTLLAASDGDKKVYLSYDYSEKSFIKFHSGELAFTTLGPRPVGSQWLAAIY